jgi:hypothetical protein
MNATHSTTRLLAVAVGALALFAASCSDDTKDTVTTDAPTTVAADTAATDSSVADTVAPETTMRNLYAGELSGILEVNPGECTDGVVSGSYFQMVMPGGTAEAGPFIANADSACADTNYTLLKFGPSEGGLAINDTLQIAPDPAFDADGNGLADRIFEPVKFFGVAFAIAVDPAGPAPSITESNGGLTGDLSAITAYYGNGVFNQGAPKPDGSGSAPTGTMNPVDGHYKLDWTSLIVGGSFDGFTGVWHIEGRFTPNA